MFILREYSHKNPVYNMSLGEDYSVIYRSNNEVDFKTACAKFWEKEEHIPDSCYALVIYNNGIRIYPLYSGVNYYIMTGNGSTFDNLTFR